MARGRPPKRPRNTSGLKQNQPKPAEDTRQDRQRSPSPSEEGDGPGILDDSLRVVINANQDGEAPDSDLEEISDCENEADEVLRDRMCEMAFDLGDEDSGDEEWVPGHRRKKRAVAGTRPHTYAKGPDVGSKSDRTRRRYAKLLRDQSSLELHWEFMTPRDSSSSTKTSARQDSRPSTATATGSDITHREVEGRQQDLRSYFSGGKSVSTDLICTVASDPASADDLAEDATYDRETAPANGQSSGAERGERVAPVEADMVQVDGDEPDAPESWQDELSEHMKMGADIRGWDVLRDQIKADLKNKKRNFTLTQINQLLIIRNFATLRLKGCKRIPASEEIARQWHEAEKPAHFARRVRALAAHYQLFEQLPQEKWGGAANARSPLEDPVVKAAARDWLTAQKAGSITPRSFQRELNSTILPSVGIHLKRPLVERTARRWLIKLGWRLTVLRKGVYMDGHERPDVVKYRQEVFLPLMEKYEARMVHFEGPELKRTEPQLAEGEQEIVPYHHDECSFHANDFKSRAWLAQGQTILQRKGRGRLIHVSDFITPLTGRLVQRDIEGNIVQDAREIIYPGANGDPWWDAKQFLAQLARAIEIHKAVHPGKQALFLLDHSSAHGSLAPDALRAFDMNKSDGGKQRIQRDTIIPETSPNVGLRGKVQKMTNTDGKPRGLKSVLEERGFDVSGMRAKCSPVCPWENENCCMARLLSKQEDFANQKSMVETLITEAGHLCVFLPKFHCELNPIEMYWGWCKYRYREVPKPTFAEAKRVALEKLDACPTDVIRRFINRTWRFMSAYRLGLTGKAAEWAVRK